jgi:hypothetical protein
MPAAMRVTKLYHGDTRFSKKERELIVRAIENINTQTNGVVFLGVVFDLDWENIDTLKTRSRDEMIVQMRADSTTVEKKDHEMPKGNIVLGWCDVEWEDPTYATRVFLVVDRLETEQKYTHVVMHELMHSLRMQHISGKKYSVLYWQTTGESPSTCFSYYDAEELCRVHHCKVEEISYCE